MAQQPGYPAYAVQDPYYWGGQQPYNQMQAVMGAGPQSPEAITARIAGNIAAERSEQQAAQQGQTAQQAIQLRQQEFQLEKKQQTQSEVAGGIGAIGSIATAGKTFGLWGQAVPPATTAAATGATAAAMTPEALAAAGETGATAGAFGNVGAAGATASSGAGGLLGLGSLTIPVVGLAVAGIGIGMEELFGKKKHHGVICNELNRQGYLPDDIHDLDVKYSQEHPDPMAYIGYFVMARPIVTLMQRSWIVTQIVKPFGLAWAYEMASRMNPDIKGNNLGKWLMKHGTPFCRRIGNKIWGGVICQT